MNFQEFEEILRNFRDFEKKDQEFPAKNPPVNPGKTPEKMKEKK
jgi:hypothetical protein